VSATAGCQWTAQSNVQWVTVTGVSSGSGSGVFNYSVAENGSPVCATTIKIATRLFSIEQDGCAAAPPSALSPVNNATVATPVLLSWDAVSGAIAYNVVITAASGPVITATALGAAASVMLQPGRYSWYVEAIFAACPTLRSAATNELTVAMVPRRRA